MRALLDSDESGFEFEVEMIARCIALGLPIAWVPIRTIYAGEPSHIRPWAALHELPARQPRRAAHRARRRPVSVNVRPATTQPDPVDAEEGRAARLIRRFAPDVVAVGLALVGGGLVVAALEQVAGFDNGSSAFLLAVVAVAVARGTGPAVVTAIGAFLVYDFFFTAPHLTFTVSDPAEWLNVLLLLVVGVVVGRLAGRERDRADLGVGRRTRGQGALQGDLLVGQPARHRAGAGADRPDAPRRDPHVEDVGRRR